MILNLIALFTNFLSLNIWPHVCDDKILVIGRMGKQQHLIFQDYHCHYCDEFPNHDFIITPNFHIVTNKFLNVVIYDIMCFT